MKKCGSINLIVTISMVIAMALFLSGHGLAGSLEPSDPPGPTMRTLDEIYNTNSWSKKLQCDIVDTIHGPRPVCPRFEVLADFNNEAVLDKETGLIWEKSPITTAGTLSDATIRCNLLTTGERLGWRLPSIQELASLADPTVPAPGPTLPSGHPFSSVQTAHPYWSANCDMSQGCLYQWVANFNGVNTVSKGQISGYEFYVWCVRGGPGADAQ